MGGLFSTPPAPEIVVDLTPKRTRKPVDYAQLILPRTKRLTPSFWILKEGMTQDVRRIRDHGTGRQVLYDWRNTRRLLALTKKGWLEEIKGPRGGCAFRTTSEGAFMVLITEGQVEALKLTQRGNDESDGSVTLRSQGR